MEERIMTIGTNTIKKERCYACNELFGDHSHKDLLRCLFRVQGTLIINAKELWEYKEMEADQMRELDKKQDTKRAEANARAAEMGGVEWKDVDLSSDEEKENKKKALEMITGAAGRDTPDMEELDKTGKTLFETKDDKGNPVVMEAIDAESDYGKKILAEEREKQKNKRKPKKGVKITKVDVERNKDGKD